MGSDPSRPCLLAFRSACMDDDPTGDHASSAWSLVDDVESAYEVASVDDDVVSVASSLADVRSLCSASTARSIGSTAVFGDHLFDLSTALTAGAPIPLAALPESYGFVSRRSGRGDGDSLVSVTTRRGWPRVAASARISAPMVPRLVQECGSYRDALLRTQPSARPPPPPQQTSETRSDVGGQQLAPGWRLLPRRRSTHQARPPLQRVDEETGVISPADA